MKASQKTGLHDFDSAKPGDRFCLFVLLSPCSLPDARLSCHPAFRSVNGGGSFIVKKIE